MVSRLRGSPGRPPRPQLLEVVWCSAAVVAVVVVRWSCTVVVVKCNECIAVAVAVAVVS